MLPLRFTRIASPARMLACSAIVLSQIGVAAFAHAAELTRRELRVPGSVQRVVAVDLDVHGSPELLVFSVSGDLNPQRHASVFAFNAEGLQTEPRSSWVLDPEGGVFDVGNDPRDGPSLWYCTATSVRRYRLRSALESAPTPETWVELPSLLGGRSDEWVMFYDFVGDWYGDGREVPAVFQPGRLLLSHGDPSQPPNVLELRTELDTTGPPASYEMLERVPLFLTQRIPTLTRVDADGDGRADLVAALGDRLATYVAGEDGTYASTPRSDIRFPSNADPRDETRRQYIELGDVTGDGRTDAVLSSLVGGFGNLTHELAVFRGEGEGFATRSTNTLMKQGAASLTSLADFDRDGRDEIVTATVKIGIRALLTYLLTSSVPIEYDVYRVGDDGAIGKTPMMQWTRSVVLRSTGASDPGVITLTGDFDGDGIDDVVSASSDDEVEIRRVLHVGKRLELGDVLAELEATGRGQALAPDLNGDGRSDLVVYAPRRAEGVVTVFLSGGTPPEIKAPRD